MGSVKLLRKPKYNNALKQRMQKWNVTCTHQDVNPKNTYVVYTYFEKRYHI